jgi:trimeric autotransporter adhesin
MQKRIRDHIRSNVIGYVALFCFAMGGTAYATHPGGADTISSGDIINGEVRGADIGDFEVRAAEVAPDSLGGNKIVDRSVKNADLSIGASSSNTIADGGIQGIDVKNNTLTGTQIDESTLFNDNSLTGADIDESTLTGVPSTNAWGLTGNAGTTGATFLGTTDNQPLNLRVNNARALRLEPASDGTNQSPNVIGGIADNSVTSGVHSAVIGGGGRGVPADPATANRVTDHQGTVGGGANNQAGDDAGTAGDHTLATVGGGGNNRATGEAATVSGGFFDTASGLRSTVGGGDNNTASGDKATVGGGDNNVASGGWAAVGGGLSNQASGTAATVSGGNTNNASGLATVGGGESNSASASRATVGGGSINQASGFAATVPGGQLNTAQGEFSLAGGFAAQANHNGAFVWADSNLFNFASTAQDQFNVRSTGGARLVSGIDGSGNPSSGLELPAGTSGWSTLVDGQPFDVTVNCARGLRIDPASDGTNQSPNVIGGSADNSVTAGVHSAVIGGGGRDNPAFPNTANRVTDNYGTVGGGAGNQAGDSAGTVDDPQMATVGGGLRNFARGEAATVGGGFANDAQGDNSLVGGGAGNTASGIQATVPGGFDNTAAGTRSLAAGTQANAIHDGAFVWADDQFTNMTSTAANQFIARASGDFFLQSDSSLDDQGGFINTSTGGFLSNGGAWTNASDKNLKAGFERLHPKQVLKQVESLPVRSWHYKAEPSVRHIGPVAQDFYRAFGVGEDRRHISSVDADGVALAAIKGLSRKVERLQDQVASLKEQEGSR